MTGINYDDLNNYMYVSENYGKDWKRLKGNLPNEPVNLIIEDPIYEDILYAGMYRGVYISLDRGISWNLVGENFPMTSVSDIEIHEETNDMIVSSHGRGIYKINLNPIHNYFINREILKIDKILYTEKFILPKFNDTHREPLMNTFEKVPVSFYLNEKKKYSLIIKDKEEVLWELNGFGKEGLNQIRWDLILEKNNNQRPYHIHFNKFINAGNYTLILKTDDNIHNIEIDINEYN